MTTIPREHILKANWQNYPSDNAIYPSMMDIISKGPTYWFVKAYFEQPEILYHCELKWDHVAAIVYEILTSQIGKTVIFHIEGDVFPLALAGRSSKYPAPAQSINDIVLFADITRTRDKWYHFHFKYCNRDDESTLYSEHHYDLKVRR